MKRHMSAPETRGSGRQARSPSMLMSNGLDEDLQRALIETSLDEGDEGGDGDDGEEEEEEEEEDGAAGKAVAKVVAATETAAKEPSTEVEDDV